MSTLFFRNKRIFALAVLMIIAAGASALSAIGRQEDPTITNLFATVVTPYPGADPARVESLVTEKIEEELRGIAEIDEISSVSRTGVSLVTIELSQFISDQEIEQAWSEIRDALADAAVRFPMGVPEPEFDNDRTGAFSAIVSLQARDGVNASPAVLKRYAELFQDRVRALSGTKNVETFGAQEEEILVAIDARKLSARGLTADQVSAAIAHADSKVQAGQIRGTGTDLLIEVTGEIKSLDRIRRIPVINGNSSDIVRVGDLADVRRTVRAPAQSLASTDGRPAILVGARLEDNLQVDAWILRLKRELVEFQAQLPGGLEAELLFDQSAYTAERLTEVTRNMLIGMSLVIGVLLITLGWRAAVVVALILPMATLMSISALQFLGVPIHQMSVTGLIVALGLLVDAAIVMSDEIRKRLEIGMARIDAVAGSVSRLAIPLLASTLTTVLAFMPMVLLPGPAGDFVGSIATAVIVMLTSSFVLALTLAPAMAGWLLRIPAEGQKIRWWSGGLRSNLITGAFARSLSLALNYPKLAILAALIPPIIGFGAMPALKAQFFPGVDRNQFYVQVKLPGGASITDTQRVSMKASDVIEALDGVTGVTWVIGESAPAFYYNMQMNQDGVPSFAEALVTTDSPTATERILPVLQRELDAAVPSARITVRGLVQGPPVNAPVEVRIVGPNLQELRALGERFRLVMLNVPEITQARTQMSGGEPKIFLDLDEEKVRLAGLELSSVARQLEATLEGATGGSLIEASEELPVRVRVGASERSAVDALRSLDVVAGDALETARQGAYPGVPLSALGELDLRPGKTPIFRRNGERINTVQGFVHRSILPEEALKKVLVAVEEEGLQLPAGYRLEIGGDADARNETLRNLIGSMGIIIVLSLATIVLTFNSFRLSVIAIVVAVLSMGLSLLALAIFDFPFGIQAIIGVIGSIGVSINAALIIMTSLQANPGAQAGDAESVRDVVVSSGRHIVSTTITTFGGFLPLILAGGGFWPPFAMAIAGGVLLSTIVSFYFTPPAYLLAIRWSKRPAYALGKHPEPAAP